MTDLNLPSVFVPLIGLIFPALSIIFLFIYVQKNNIL
uniref:Photosystem I reaction center subunit VIII n=4 Tax=Cyperus subgen. Cyperus TaxID=1982031 RepID=A0A7G5XUR7_9POAL|nr:photosystem I subunit VIII [Cyperus rotundus]YP_009946222.1 photosystem I subunit VIII [Cyperus aromaticus]YP_010045755.1 photosystem I subunit VIII [Cyperus exaltatus]YP_010045845.1 photosystem I subunit VIII [Cyperus iria]YP_010200603.1 photosystem I subunit VIII [Cyperus esculentus]YP_010290696.1 photosystem I subunit VIII [Cyperus glomeratus]YP_010292619.1 photosystem I subunit VIII [Cyperus michelianus]YP_010944430.1 photosystem I subunit VIII [Cyperus malaccensis]YP_010985785.1 pho